jgi:glycosyltransferase involved in cell wall biosynthesis
MRERLSPEVNVRYLGKWGRWDVIGFLRRLFRVLYEERPDVLYSFLPVANLVGCLTRLRLPKLKLAWGVRVSNMDLTRYDWLSWLTYWLERRLSRCPNIIVSNSAAGRRYAVSHGFPNNDRFIVIPNGIDVEHFRPNASLGGAVRAEWGVLPAETLVGIVARLDPMKDHLSFLEAAAGLARHAHAVRFVSVGADPENYGPVLRERARTLGLDKRMIWAGPRGDLPAVYNALDLLVSSSASGEGFSNVLGEALACGLPCIATDVGDARAILGDNDCVVPPSNPEALAAGILALLERRRSGGTDLSARLRQRITESFSVEVMVRRTEMALVSML